MKECLVEEVRPQETTRRKIGCKVTVTLGATYGDLLGKAVIWLVPAWSRKGIDFGLEHFFLRK